MAEEQQMIYRYAGKEYPALEYQDWTSAELSAAEHAFGCALDGVSTGDLFAAMFWVSVRRVEPDWDPVNLADTARRMKMGELMPSEGSGPLVEDHGAQRNGGLPPLEPSESLSELKTSP